MQTTQRRGALDRFRLIAALLVTAIHISPLAGIHPDGDFWLTRVLARVAVPFFLMTTGQFALKSAVSARKFLRKTLALYALAILLYLPLGVYGGRFRDLTLGGALRMLVFDGTFYHLWYFPACVTGALIALALLRLPSKAARFAAAGALYLAGLLGDSYWGVAQSVPALKSVYESLFQCFSYTRNGLFMAPLFLLLGREIGAADDLPRRKTCFLGAAIALTAMTAEAFLLRDHGFMRHDSMYLTLPALCACLFAGLWQIPMDPRPRLRAVSAWVYVLHPAVIVAVRALAKRTGLTGILVEDALVHYFAVCALSLLAGGLLSWRPPKPSKTGRAWIELDESALRHNADFLRSKLPKGCALMAVVKADAYGHGAAWAARTLRRSGVNAFCVATVAEGAALRRRGIRGEILILGYTHPDDFPALRFWRLTQAVVDADYARQLSAFGKKLRVHVALDTGMHRLGLDCRDEGRIAQVFQMKGLRIDGMFSHLCVSDADTPAGRAYTRAQAEALLRAADALEARGLQRPRMHLLASDGILNDPEYALDAVRAGVALYGALSDRTCAGLRPVLTLKARVASVRTLKPGQSAGYGLAFTAQRETRIAVITIGYADGVPRALSEGRGRVLLGGAEAPIAGRICMDQLLVDASGAGPVRSGDVATLIGTSGGRSLSVQDWARACGTISNEILSRLGARLPRIEKPMKK